MSSSSPTQSKMEFPPKTLNLNSSTSKRNPNPDIHLPPPLQCLQYHISSFLTSLSSNPTISQIHSTIKTLSTRFKPPVVQLAHAGPLPMSLPQNKSVRMTAKGMVEEEDMKELLKGVPVYVLSDAEKNMMLVSGVKSGKSLGLLCFREDDAEALLDQMKLVDPELHQGAQVVSVGLNQVFNLKVDDVAFRFIPDSHQILNAIKTMEQLGGASEAFPGVPVFLSRSLVMKSQNKRYRPAFLRKEDLDDALFLTSRFQKQLNPAFRKEDIQICALEEMISDMKEDSMSKWSDVVFIPPGFNVSKRISDGSSNA